MQTFFVTFQGVTLAILLSAIVGTAQFAWASNSESTKPSSSVQISKNQPKLSTDMSFDDLNVNGRRQSPFGATATVEADKKAIRFVDFRSNYSDRVQNSRTGR